MSDILKRLMGESALPVYSNIEKFRRGKDGLYFVAEDFNETVKKRELVNAKERMRVSISWKSHLMNQKQMFGRRVVCLKGSVHLGGACHVKLGYFSIH